MSEYDEFAQMVQAAVASEQNTSPPAPEAKPETKDEQKADPEVTATATDSGNTEVKTDAPKDEPKEETKPEEKKVETKPEEKPEPKKADWKAAAERERQKRLAREQDKQQNAALTQKISQLEQKIAKWEEIEAEKKTNLLGAASKAGFDYDVLTKEYLRSIDSGKPDLVTPQSPEVRELVQKIQQLESAFASQQQTIAATEQQKWLQEHAAGIKRTIEAKADDFELTKTAEEGAELVQAIVAAHWNKTAKFDSKGNLIAPGEMMPTEEACKLAEDYFLEKQIKRFSQTKKFLSLTKPAETPKPKEPEKPTVTTLTSSLRQGGGAHVPTFGNETEELLAMIQKIEAQGN